MLREAGMERQRPTKGDRMKRILVMVALSLALAGACLAQKAGTYRMELVDGSTRTVTVSWNLVKSKIKSAKCKHVTTEKVLVGSDSQIHKVLTCAKCKSTWEYKKNVTTK